MNEDLSEKYLKFLVTGHGRYKPLDFLLELKASLCFPYLRQAKYTLLLPIAVRRTSLGLPLSSLHKDVSFALIEIERPGQFRKTIQKKRMKVTQAVMELFTYARHGKATITDASNRKYIYKP